MKGNSWLSSNFVVLALLVALVVIVINGVRTGSATLAYRTYKKSEDPELYWTGIVVPILGIAGLIYGLLFQ